MIICLIPFSPFREFIARAARKMAFLMKPSCDLPKWFFPVLGGLFLFCFDPSEVWGQGETARSFGPQIGLLKTTFHFEGAPYQKEAVTSQPDKELQMRRYNASLLVPLAQDPKEEWGLIGSFRGQDIETEAILPDTKKDFPDGVWDARLGPFYRKRFENGWIGGAVLTVGSASDRPFSNMDVMELQARFSLRIPDGERNAWVALLAYSNNREFLNNVPLPGVGYWYEPSERYRILIGIPFVFLEARPFRDVSMEFSYLPVRSVRANISYRFWGPLQIYGTFDWRNESYFLSGRSDKRNRLFYYEKRLIGGVHWNLSRQVSLDLSLGYAFERLYFEARKYEDRNRNRVDVEDGPFASLRLGLRL
jgi:hypothetical protein